MSNSHLLETLYTTHSSGKVGSWQIEVKCPLETRGAIIITRAKKTLDGKATENIRTIAKGKNIGRSNETSALDQALSEARSKISKKVDKGYTFEQPQEGQVATNGLGLTKPMLATEHSKVKNVPYPALAQPKLDGNRCLAARIDGEVKLWSRGSKYIDLPHVSEALESILTDESTILDGELYCHGYPLQTINGWIKKAKPESINIQYHVYDMVIDEPYQERVAQLETLVPDNHSHIVLTDTKLVENEEEVMALHQQWVDDGYEGAIVRTNDKGYEPKRSKSLIKVKSFQDAEFNIVDVIEGTPRIKDGETLNVAIYVCETDEGKRFNVTAPGTMYEKHSAWQERLSAIGRALTVKFFNLTNDGLPFLPVALRLRDDL